MFHEFTAIIVQDGDWYCGSLVEVPGAISQGKTLEELRENLKEAAQLILDTMRDRALEGAAKSRAIVEKVAVSA
jgi:predicted RNase H-like HicB family nuclease